MTNNEVKPSFNSTISLNELSSIEVWGYGFLFVTIINLSSIMGILFFPLRKSSMYTILMRFMIGLGIGSLSGSAIFHLIPQAFHLSESNKGSYLPVSIFIILSIWIVMILESIIKVSMKSKNVRNKKNCSKKDTSAVEHDQAKTDASLPTDHSESVMIHSDTENQNETNLQLIGSNKFLHKETDIDNNKCVLPLNEIHTSTFSLNRSILNITLQNHGEEDGDSPIKIKTVAWIVIIGDGLHNFIDGVSIGAGFTQSFSTGLILSLAVICEEFPHELGDFAILINSGFTVKKAILFNFLSALTCYFGLLIGILLGKIQFEQYIFAFAAGIFLYVSLADMIPEVNEVIEEISDTFPKRSWLVLLNYHSGAICGILILYLLAANAPT